MGVTPLPLPCIALWATCLAHHGGTPTVDAQGAVWLRHRIGIYSGPETGDAGKAAADAAALTAGFALLDGESLRVEVPA